MFRVDKDDNSIKPLKALCFSELGFKERQHLQEWIANYPSCLDEDCPSSEHLAQIGA